jgi:hypothetical protein
MPIPWEQFENQITSYLKGHQAKSEKDLAEFLANKYDTYIKMGKEQYGNGILSADKALLENYIYIALLDARRGKPLDDVSKKIAIGVVLYWTTVKMQILVPPPGAVSVVTNVVAFPGTPIKFPIKNTKDPSVLAKNLIFCFKIHATTITGINTALVPVPGGGTVPTPFPWTGIK